MRGRPPTKRLGCSEKARINICRSHRLVFVLDSLWASQRPGYGRGRREGDGERDWGILNGDAVFSRKK